MGGPVCPVQRPPWPRGSTWLLTICQDLAEVDVTMCPAETFRGPGTFMARFFLFLSQLTAPAEFVSQFWNGR